MNSMIYNGPRPGNYLSVSDNSVLRCAMVKQELQTIFGSDLLQLLNPDAAVLSGSDVLSVNACLGQPAISGGVDRYTLSSYNGKTTLYGTGNPRYSLNCTPSSTLRAFFCFAQTSNLPAVLYSTLLNCAAYIFGSINAGTSSFLSAAGCDVYLNDVLTLSMTTAPVLFVCNLPAAVTTFQWLGNGSGSGLASWVGHGGICGATSATISVDQRAKLLKFYRNYYGVAPPA